MKIKNEFPFLIILFTAVILFLNPNHVVWGGQSFQTVPTLGPSRTPTKTKKITVTQLISSQTPSSKNTATKPKSSPSLPTPTFTVEVTQRYFTETSRPEITGTVTSTNSSLETESTMVVIFPHISNEGGAGEQPTQEENEIIPAFVFPLAVVLLFVIIYLSIKMLFKTSNNKNKS